MEKLLTTKEVADRLDVSVRRVREWAAAGLLSAAHTSGRDWLFTEQAVAAFVRPRMGRPPKKK